MPQKSAASQYFVMKINRLANRPASWIPFLESEAFLVAGYPNYAGSG
jgi:hypothetical protein